MTMDISENNFEVSTLAQIETLKEYRQALISNVVTRKVRVL